MKNILVVDDHLVTRAGVRSLLQEEYRQMNILEADNGDDVLKLLKTQPIDLLVFDLQIPNVDPMGMIELISIKHPHTYILVFSMMPEKIYARRAIRAGAAGYLSKDSRFEEVKGAFDAALNNKRYLSKNLLEMLANEGLAKGGTNPFEALSHREFEIVSMLLSGNTLTTIAQNLNIKPSTVGTYKARIFQKLQVENVFDLKELAVLYDFKGAQA
jgi:two-component system, NarL family, invasion response regulator UvrY